MWMALVPKCLSLSPSEPSVPCCPKCPQPPHYLQLSHTVPSILECLQVSPSEAESPPFAFRCHRRHVAVTI